MRRMIFVKGMVAALAVAMTAGQAAAGLREYCDSYARDVAHRKTNGVVVGSAGLIAGRASGTILGTGVSADRYKRAYANAFERCVDNYEGQRARNETAGTKVAGTKVAEAKVTEARAAVSKVVETKAATEAKVAENEAVEQDEAGTASWSTACARKYRSWDPQKGKYKSYSGKWKPCRL